MADTPGDDFQQKTKYIRGSIPSGPLDFASQPQLYKSYPDSEKIDLPYIKDPQGLSLYESIRIRRSIRSFSSEPITLDQLAYLLWASTGITQIRSGYAFRSAPSAGALYPIETYLCVNNVQSLDQGIYHYSIETHKLETIEKGDHSDKVSSAALDQQMAGKSAVVFIYSAVFERCKWKYRQRAYRYIYLDAGHIAENLALACVSIGLGSCHIAALYDDEANELVKIKDSSRESVIYMTASGKIK